jgi:glycosyltransferase 2 family protein
VVVGVLDVALRKVGRVPVPSRMSYPGTVRAAGWQSLCWLLYGVHAWVLAVGIGAAATPGTAAVAVGGFALAYGIGPLFVLTPAGAGVREAALVLLLGGVLGGSSAALALALVSRLVLVVTEFGQAGTWVLLERSRRAAERPDPLPVAAA